MALIIFLISLFLRLFRLPDFIAYHQDQVRDLIYVKQYFDQGQFILLGPKASVGNFFLPPFWYYLMAIMYFFSSSPVAPALLVVLFSAATTLVIYKFCVRFFDSNVAFAASLIYAVSHLSIEYTRFAWNPNPIPFFTVLTFYFLYLYLFEKKEIGFWGGIVSSNLALQLHYQGAIVALFFLLALIFYKRLSIKRFFLYVLANLLLVSPFVVYEFINNFPNTKGIISFSAGTQVNPGLKYFGIPFFIKFILFGFSSYLGKVLFFKNQLLGYVSMLILFLSLIFPYKNSREKLFQVFFIFSFVMFFIYKNSLIDFYLLFFIPPVIIYFSILGNKYLPRTVFYLVVFFVVIISVFGSPAFSKTDDTYIGIKAAANYITSYDNYCIVYKIHPTNFIESKFKYLVSLSKNQPKDINCEKILYDYQCRNEVKVDTIFYLCGGKECTVPKDKLNLMKIIDQHDYYTGINIYRLDY